MKCVSASTARFKVDGNRTNTDDTPDYYGAYTLLHDALMILNRRTCQWLC